MVRTLIREICANERITRYRLAEVLGTTHTSMANWWTGRRHPTRATLTLLKIIHRHGLKLILTGDLTQPVEPQANDRLKIT